VSDTFQGMFVPAGTPLAIVQRIVRETLEAMKDPLVLEKLQSAGFEVRARGPEALARRVAREVPMWRDVIARAGIEQM
jgi:tripartite-type tricarboxylate transporter receptor subunit TctC